MIQLNQINREHIPLVQKYASNPLIGASSNVPSPYPEDGAEAWYELVSKKQIQGISQVYAIEQDSYFLGIISLNNIHDQFPAIDYWVRADYHGKGIATQAVSEIILLSEALNIAGFISGCLESNIGSRRVLEKNNFSVISKEIINNGKFCGQAFLHMQRKST